MPFDCRNATWRARCGVRRSSVTLHLGIGKGQLTFSFFLQDGCRTTKKPAHGRLFFSR